MAMMSHVELVLLLLASHFLLPALCGDVYFRQCHVDEPDSVFLAAAAIGQPVPGLITIMLAGTAGLLIDGRETYVYVTLKTPNEGDLVLQSYLLCNTVNSDACNTEGQLVPGKSFIMWLPRVPYDSGSQQGTLSVSARNNATEPPKEYFCIDLEYPKSSAHTLASA